LSNTAKKKQNKTDYLELLDIPFKNFIKIVHENDLKNVIVSLDPTQPILITDGSLTQENFTLATEKNIDHSINENRSDFLDELHCSAKLIQNPKDFFKDPVKAMFDSHSSKQGSESELIYNQTFNQSNMKRSMANGVEAVLTQAHFPKSTIRIAVSVLDELFTNAIYNAPYMDDENLSSGAERSINNIILPEGKHIEIFVGKNDTDIIVGCRDPFGSLNIDYIKEKILNCYKVGASDAMNLTTVGGAGIGTYLLVEASATYIAAVNEGKETIVMASLPIKMSNKKRSEYPKNYHFIKYKEGDK
jgi:hypothetical protein